jgi:electron transport complex protein RnfE
MSLRLRKERSAMSKLQIITKGILKENPIFVLVLGMCPTLGVTSSAINGMGMGVATMAVLIMSNMVIALIKNLIPDKVRIPAFIVVIASFVTIIEMLMQAYIPSLYAALGVFIPLIVVNCIILGRAEAFASKNGVLDSALDGIGIGLGFTLSLTTIGAVREVLGAGSIFGYSFADGVMPLLFILAPGGFLVLGYLMVLFNKVAKR